MRDMYQYLTSAQLRHFQEDNEGQRIDVHSLDPDVVFQTKINGKPFVAYI